MLQPTGWIDKEPSTVQGFIYSIRGRPAMTQLHQRYDFAIVSGVRKSQVLCLHNAT
jgi:hypothetical protein